MRIVLASKSPRRRELFSLITDNCIYDSSDVDESLFHAASPDQLCVCLAREKCGALIPKYPDCAVVGCDTIVEQNGVILGKPGSSDEARLMLRRLSGVSHNVFTGVCIKAPGGIESSFFCRTGVSFFPISDSELEDYIRTDETYDKAGGYGIQGRASKFLRSLDGDFFNVMGLPVSRLYRELSRLSLV